MPADFDLVIRARAAIVDDRQVAACVGVRAGRIVAITPYDEEVVAEQVIEFGEDVVLLPGLVDSHVHVNEPGRTEWEGFATATRAAAAGAGGVPMLCHRCAPTHTSVAGRFLRALFLPSLNIFASYWQHSSDARMRNEGADTLVSVGQRVSHATLVGARSGVLPGASGMRGLVKASPTAAACRARLQVQLGAMQAVRVSGRRCWC